MIQHLTYSIAGHVVVIETPNGVTTERLLSNYEPFRIHRDAEPILYFSLGKEIDIPTVSPVDEMEFEGMFSKIYVTDDFVFATTEIDGRLHKLKATKDWKRAETDLLLLKPADTFFFKHFITTAYGMASAAHKTIKMHASAIEKDSKALLFMGVSGTGKSTHSRLWLEHVPGCSLLNDDEPIVRILDDGSVRVYGAPWSGSTPCYRNISANVAAFVHLHQSNENKLSRLNVMDAISSMLMSTAVFRSDSTNKNRIVDTIVEILNIIPVYRLDCRPDREAVMLTETLIVGGD